MYRVNLQYTSIKSCDDGNCFDDLCMSCRDEIMSSDDDNEYDSTNDLNTKSKQLSTHQTSHQSTQNDYSSDDDESSKQQSRSSAQCSTRFVSQHKYDQANELNRKSYQVSRHVDSLEALFHEICDGLKRQDRKLVQLYRQFKHCFELLSTFEDFLVSFEEKTDSFLYCGNWFANIILIKERFNNFYQHRNSELLIQHLNDRMEMMYDEFIDLKRILVSDQSLSNLNSVSSELRFINTRITSAEQELEDIDDYIIIQIQEQRNVIGNFVDVMSAMCRSILSSINCNDIIELQFIDCFNGQQFLIEYHRILNCIQII